MDSTTGQTRSMTTQCVVYGVFLPFLILLNSISFSLTATAEEVDLFMADVSFKTVDQVKISSSWVIPRHLTPASKPRPVVILLHDYGLDRRDWGIFIPDLIQQGYNVLAIDLRGHGQSEGGSASTPASMMQSAPRDLEAAVKWITSQKTSDAKKISVIGVGIGADIAYLYAGQFPKDIYATVVISPSHTSVTYGNFLNANPRKILYCTTSKAKQGQSMLAAETLSNFTEQPKKLVIYDGAAYGLAIFYTHPEIKEEIFAWLSQ